MPVSAFLLNRSSDLTLIYAVNRIPEIADDVVNVDNAMKWGFGWEQGPFETWDAIGVRESVEKMKQEGHDIPAFVQSLLDSGNESFYKEENGDLYFFNGTDYTAVPVNEKVIDLKRYKKKHGVLKSNSGASLIDLGDGICLRLRRC